MIGLILLSEPATNEDNIDNFADLYFVNPITNIFEVEKRNLTANLDSDKVVEILQYLFVTGSNNQSVKNLTQREQIYQNLEILDGTVMLYLNDVYGELSEIDKIFARASITWSLTSLDSIKNVVFYYGDEMIPIGDDLEVYQYNRSNVVLNPTVDPKDMIIVELKLYYGSKDLNALKGEMQSVNVNPNISRETYVVEQLIKGSQNKDSQNLIPAGTKILKVETDNRICYVNLSGEFISKQGEDLNKQNLAVYSIVNSLTELGSVGSVQILIDSKRVESFGDKIDLSNTLTRDETLIQEEN